MEINNLITRLRDIGADMPDTHTINQAADMLTMLKAENNKLQDELKCREAEIARLNEAREIANEKAREYEKRKKEMEQDVDGMRANWYKSCKTVKQQRKELERRDKIIYEFEQKIEKVERERDAAVKELFKWTSCTVCKYWNSKDEWCEKHDRSATSVDGCSAPEWRGMEEQNE